MQHLTTTIWWPCKLPLHRYNLPMNATDPDALRQQGLSEFWSADIVQRGAVPMHVPNSNDCRLNNPVWRQASLNTAMLQRCEPHMQCERDKMLRTNLRAWPRPPRPPDTHCLGEECRISTMFCAACAKALLSAGNQAREYYSNTRLINNQSRRLTRYANQPYYPFKNFPKNNITAH